MVDKLLYAYGYNFAIMQFCFYKLFSCTKFLINTLTTCNNLN